MLLFSNSCCQCHGCSLPPQAPRQDESGSGIEAGKLSDWGFAGGAQQGVLMDSDGLEVDPTLALNHMGGQSMGDRQSSRHGSRQGSRKSGRKSAGKQRKKSSVSMPREYSLVLDFFKLGTDFK